MTWLEHLNDTDLALLARAQPDSPRQERLKRDDLAIEALLASPALFDVVFGAGGQEQTLSMSSPFLTFAVVVHRSWHDLRSAGYVEEWAGPRRRLPVLGGTDLHDFLASSERRIFLAELLASYTHVTSGTTWVPTRRGFRRQRFSELDPVRMASLLDVVADWERPGVYRRLGDLALFLTGVFPDHTETRGLGDVAEARLLRSGGLPASEPRVHALPVPGFGGPVGMFERLGVRWYQLAVALIKAPLTGTMTVVGEVAERFGQARRILNFLTDRYLLPCRSQWFGGPAH